MVKSDDNQIQLINRLIIGHNCSTFSNGFECFCVYTVEIIRTLYLHIIWLIIKSLRLSPICDILCIHTIHVAGKTRLWQKKFYGFQLFAGSHWYMTRWHAIGTAGHSKKRERERNINYNQQQGELTCIRSSNRIRLNTIRTVWQCNYG